MQFIELYHIYADFHTDSRFHCERTVIFECHQLYHHTFTVVQLGLFELLQQKFRIRLYQTMRTGCPGLSFGTRIGIIHIIITIVHQICLERCSADSLDILRNKSQKNIQDISTFHLGLTINRYLRFLQTDRLRLRNLRLHSRRPCRSSGRAQLLLFFPLLLGSRFGCRSGDIIIIGLYHHTFVYGHRYVKTVGIFHQHDVFPLKSCHNTAPNFAEETNFISYLHSNLSFSLSFPTFFLQS